MKQQQKSRLACPVAMALGISLAYGVAAGAAELPLSPALKAQIAAILAEKESRTPAEAKIESSLFHGMKALVSPGQFASRPRFIRDFVETQVATDSTVRVIIRAQVGDDLIASLKAAGAKKIRAHRKQGAIYARVPIAQLTNIAARPEVRFIETYRPPVTNRRVLSPEQLRIWLENNPVTNAGSQTSQGVATHGADKVQQSGLTGAGTKVCVLSDGVDSLAARQASGDLPASVDVLSGQAGSGDEGTAMLEIVHDMAPGAALGFATALNGMDQMAANIQTLRASPHNCDIIVDDVTYFFEPPFQPGVIDQAVTAVANDGALYFSSAGNSGSAAKGTAGTWEGDYVQGSTINITSGGVTSTHGMHSFGASTRNIITATGSAYILTWADPQSGSSNDYDLLIVNSGFTTILGYSNSVQNGTQMPAEGIDAGGIPAGSIILILNKQQLAQPRALRLDTMGGELSIATEGNTFGHNAGTDAITLGAVCPSNIGGGVCPIGGALPGQVESYSSDGPRQIFFTPTSAEITAGNILFGTNGGAVLDKVDFAAVDCVSTTTPGFSPFCGTSAAAPHAAAIAALIKSAKPALTPAQINSALTLTAQDIEVAGQDVIAGKGFLKADAAVASVLTKIDVSKVYSSPIIAVSGTSTLKFTLSNTNGVDLQGIALSDGYPANVVNAATPGAALTGGCTGTITAVPGGNSLNLSGATIPAGASCILKVKVTSGQVGTYTDTGGALTTPIGLNAPAASATLSVVPAIKPDYVVSNVVLNTLEPYIKGRINVSVTVTNQGTASGKGGYLDIWTNQGSSRTCGATGEGSVAVGSLTVGASRTFAFKNLPVGQAGAKVFRAFVDSGCVAAELDDDNNQTTVAYNVKNGVASGPDFMITNIVPSVASPTAKSTFSVDVTIKNQGPVSGSGGFVDVWADQAATPTCPADGNAYSLVGTLAAGASKTITIVGVPAGAAGNKKLRAFVDSYCQTLETDESNNQSALDYTVIP